MTANNIVGSVLDIKPMAKIAKDHNVTFHTNAVLATWQIPINSRDLGSIFSPYTPISSAGPKG